MNLVEIEDKNKRYSFEPGSICCAYCGWRPEDRWDDAPEGFMRDEHGEWVCGEGKCQGEE